MPSRLAFRGPLADSYWAAVMLVVCALVPYLALSSALTPLQPVLEKSLPLGPQAFEITTGMANAAYAFGTVLAVQFAVHLRGRRMLLLYVCLFIVGSVLAALAPTPGLFIAGHVLQGLTTSLMLIAAVPPLVVGWPTRRMPISGAVMNLCVFGAVALGPVLGGVQAGTGHWRPLFWVVAGIGGLALLFTLLTYEDQPPQDTSAPWDWVAIVLAGGGTSAAFFGASELQTHPMLDLIVFLPLVVGLVMIVALVAYEYGARRPLMPVRRLATTFPVASITVVMCAGAASVALIVLVETALRTRFSPTHTAMLFWPQFGAALVAAVLFGALFRTRLIPVLVLAGTLALAGGAAELTGVAHGPAALVLIGSGLVGLGVGWCVSPALFITGFSVPSAQIQRVFALVELLRGVAALIAGPLLLHLAVTVGSSPAAGTRTAIWVCLGITAGGGLLALYLYALGRQPLRPPDLDRWQAGEAPAWRSPPLAAGIRGEMTEPAPG